LTRQENNDQTANKLATNPFRQKEYINARTPTKRVKQFEQKSINDHASSSSIVSALWCLRPMIVLSGSGSKPA
jgi:hypothetical protein